MRSDEHQIRILVPLLRQAADRWNALVDQDIFGSDETARGLGRFCSDTADQLERVPMVNSLSQQEAKRLFRIFAPTCEWDDSVGDVELGNSIFELVDGLFREVVMTNGDTPTRSDCGGTSGSCEPVILDAARKRELKKLGKEIMAKRSEELRRPWWKFWERS